MNAAQKDRSATAWIRGSSRSSQLRRYGGRRRGGEGGFTLVEVLIALGAMSLALGLGAVAFSDVVHLRGAEDRYQQRLTSVDFLLRRIARDVRPGRAFLARVELSGANSGKAEKFAAGADTMIVSTGTEIVVYRAAVGKVERIEVAKDRTERGLVLDAPGVRVAFDLEGAPPASARSVVTTAEWTEPPSVGVSQPTLSLRLALRNPDRRVNEP